MWSMMVATYLQEDKFFPELKLARFIASAGISITVKIVHDAAPAISEKPPC